MAYKKFTASEDMLKPDPRFNSKLVSKFINCLMWQGKKTVAMKCFYGAMDQIAKKSKDKEGAAPPLEVFEGAIQSVLAITVGTSGVRSCLRCPVALVGVSVNPVTLDRVGDAALRRGFRRCRSLGRTAAGGAASTIEAASPGASRETAASETRTNRERRKAAARRSDAGFAR